MLAGHLGNHNSKTLSDDALGVAGWWPGVNTVPGG
jgi:hypothetical protein